MGVPIVVLADKFTVRAFFRFFHLGRISRHISLTTLLFPRFIIFRFLGFLFLFDNDGNVSFLLLVLFQMTPFSVRFIAAWYTFEDPTFMGYSSMPDQISPSGIGFVTLRALEFMLSFWLGRIGFFWGCFFDLWRFRWGIVVFVVFIFRFSLLFLCPEKMKDIIILAKVNGLQR